MNDLSFVSDVVAETKPEPISRQRFIINCLISSIFGAVVAAIINQFLPL